jgi:hypothetical protein
MGGVMMPVPGQIHVVFIHGLFSRAKTWGRMQELVEADPELAGLAAVRLFSYESRPFRFNPARRVAEIDDIADRLHTYLHTDLRDAESVILVSHSMGGLVVQRFLARTLARARGRDLARISRIVLFCCPNQGSDFALMIRQLARFWRHPHEQELRPFSRAVMEAQQAVLDRVVHAEGRSDTECRIPIRAVSAMYDNIVHPVIATSVCTSSSMVDGDHFSAIKPASADASSYLVLKAELLAPESLLADPAAADRPGQEGEGQSPDSVLPPFARREEFPLRGRTQLITSVMSGGMAPNAHVLAGLGGSGKSRLALEIAYRAEQTGRKVWWVVTPRINSCMREVANQAGAPSGQIERAFRGEGSATDLTWRALNAYQDPWLLVFDNADNPAILGPPSGPVSDGTGWLRPPARHGIVLVTSRDVNEQAWGPWCRVHHVPPLPDIDGAAMLLDRLQKAGLEAGTQRQARQLSRELGGLPLALRAAADYIISVRTRKVYEGPSSITDIESYRAAVSRRPGEPADDRDLTASIGLEIVQEVYEMALGLLADRGLPQAAPLARLLACFGITPVPYYALLDGVLLARSPLFSEFSVRQRDTVLVALADLGLIDLQQLPNVGSPALSHTLSLHPLVRGILGDDADVRDRRTDYYGLSVQLLLAATGASNPDYQENWETWDVLAPHAVEVARTTLGYASQLTDSEVISKALELARQVARYMIAVGLIAPVRNLVQPLVRDCAAFGLAEDDKEILGLRHEKARIALESGEPGVAEQELRLVITARTRVLGVRHPDTLASQHKLARAILEQGRWPEAEALLRQVVADEFTVRGKEHSDTMVVRHSLARAILAQKGGEAEAEQMMREILEIRLRKWSPTTPETLFAQQTLARALLGQEDATDAERNLGEVLEQTADRPDVPMVLSLRHTLCSAILMQGRIAEAVESIEALLADRVRVLGEAHPDTASTRDLLEGARGILDLDDPGG